MLNSFVEKPAGPFKFVSCSLAIAMTAVFSYRFFLTAPVKISTETLWLSEGLIIFRKPLSYSYSY